MHDIVLLYTVVCMCSDKKFKDPELNDSRDYLNLFCFQLICKQNLDLFIYKILKEFIRLGSASKELISYVG
jgi:hypothetical protein